MNEFEDQVIDHAKCYVDGQVHTDGMENFWSLLKHGINGTYVSVIAMKQIVGRRIMYKELIGAADNQKGETQ